MNNKSIFIMMAVILTLLLLYQVYTVKKTENWIQTQGSVVSQYVSRVSQNIGYKHYLEVEYEYQVNNITYKNDTVESGFKNEFSTEVSAEAALKKLIPDNQHVTVYYNPNNPTQSALYKFSEEDARFLWMLPLLWGMMMGILYFVIMYVFPWVSTHAFPWMDTHVFSRIGRND